MLWKKFIRDIKHNIPQFITIFLMAFLAMVLYTGLASEVYSVKSAMSSYHKQTHLADEWIIGENFDFADATKLQKINGIETVQLRLQQKDSGEDGTVVYMNFENSDSLSQPLVVEGEDYDPTDQEGIWLNARFAAENNISLGQDYQITHNVSLKTYVVKGFIWDAEYEYYKDDVAIEPDYQTVGYAYASINSLDTDEQKWNQVLLSWSNGEKKSTLQKVKKVLSGKYTTFYNHSGLASLVNLSAELDQHETLSLSLPAFFIVICLLTLMTTMKRIIDRQRTQIGTLKALGMKKWKIYVHYLSYGGIISFIGAVMGIIIGPQLLAPSLFKMKFFYDTSDEYMLPHFGLVYPAVFWIIGFGLVLLCVIVTWLSCRQILAIQPAQSLRPAPPKSAKASFIERLAIWKKLSFSVRYNIRDIIRNKFRSLLGFVGVMLCMALLLSAFASKQDFSSSVTDWYISKLLNNANFITLSESASLSEKEEVARALNGELVMSDTAVIRTNDTDETSVHINVYENSTIAKVTDIKLNVQTLSDDDFTITEKTAKQLHLSVGDTIEWHPYGTAQWQKNTITKIVRSPLEQGITTTKTVLENNQFDFTPTRLLTKQKVTKSLKKTYNIIESIESSSDIVSAMGNYLELINLFTAFIIILAVFLAVVVLYSMGLLTFEERRNELATLKVIGFGTKKLRTMLLQQNLIITIIAILFGIPLGKVILDVLLNSLGDSIDIPAQISLTNLILAMGITFVVSILVNLLFTNKIRKLDMVEEFKNRA